MSSNRPERGNRGHHQRTIGLLRSLAVASVGLPIVLLLIGSLLTWQNRQQDTWDRSVRLTNLIYESTSKLIDAQLLAAEQAALMVSGMDDDAIVAEQRVLHDRLNAMLRHLPHLRELFVVSRSGHALVVGSRYPAPATTDLRQRDYFRYFRDGGTGLFVGEPGHRYVDGLDFFPLAIRRPSADGRFTGVIAASVNPEYFKAFFQQALKTYPDFDGRVITLRRGDGLLLVRSEPVAPGFAAAGEDAAADVLRSDADSGQFASRSMGEQRLVAWRRLPNANIVVFCSVAKLQVVRAWATMMLPYLVFGLLATAALLSITLLALQHTRLAQAAEEQAEAERQKRHQAEEAARLGQKMEAIGKLTGGIAHDFNNLLAVILGNAELAKLRPSDKVTRLLDNIIHAGQRGAKLTRQLLSFSRTQSVEPKVLDPHTELPRMLELLKPSLRGSVVLDVQVAEDVWLVEVDPGEWEIALLNIAVNARDVMPDGGRFTVTAENVRITRGGVSAVPEMAGDFVRIALRDTGPGILPDVAARAFEPFFTTKDVGRGTGLGLSQVYGFARQAGGAATIQAAPPPDQGTTVAIYLPRSDKRPESLRPATLPASTRDTGVRRVLLVEDNPDVAAITIEIIQALSCEVVHADRARTALDLLAKAEQPFHLLLSDVVMPDGMNGLELATIVRRRMPTLPIILVSGYNDALPQDGCEFRVLRKPLPVEQLSEAILAEMRSFPRIVVDNISDGGGTENIHKT